MQYLFFGLGVVVGVILSMTLLPYYLNMMAWLTRKEEAETEPDPLTNWDLVTRAYQNRNILGMLLTSGTVITYARVAKIEDRRALLTWREFDPTLNHNSTKTKLVTPDDIEWVRVEDPFSV